MNSSARVERIFSQAVEIGSPSHREVFLNGACGDDAALRQHVEQLLRAHEAAGGFLKGNTAAAEQAPTVSGGPIMPLTEAPGTQIGRYKLLQQIGEGGFGLVYMAEQKEPVKRRVALKIIKLGMDTKQVVARFEAERQALAMMDHPNIAKVFDAGATESGRPYFVMELVKGMPITKFCDENNLSTKERLELFTTVCNAIQHAHQKGIIHRDIKPSNILVTLHDGKPVPKVIDFGIAKATQQELTEKTIFTQFQQMIGTPAYMSPEQAEMSGLDIDTRTDVYSLGVLLYELLTGKTPLDAKILLSGGYDEIRRRIKEEEPLRPSTRVSTMEGDELTGHAKHRNLDPKRFAAELRGDLDWIVMKALEKDRTRRYDSATAFALDVQRFLGNEPVIARPPNAAYRFQKLVRRNKFAVATAAIVVVTLMLGTFVSTWQAVLATRARNNAKEAASREREQYRRAEAQAELTRQNLYASEMVLAMQALETKSFGFAREVLDRHRPQPNQADLRGWEWRYVWAATRSDALRELGSHSNGVNSVAFSPNGNLLASSSVDHTVKLWSTETGRETAVLPHDTAVRTVAFSADGKQLATVCFGGYLRTWDIRAGSEISRTAIGKIDPLTGNGCAFSGNGERFANGQADGTVNVWDVANGKKITTLRAEGPLFCLAFSCDGNLLAGGGRFTNWVGAWNLGTGELFCSFTNHTVPPVDAVAFSPNGEALAVANHDGSIKLWDLTKREPLRTLLGHSSWIPGVNFSPDGGHLVSASTDHTAILWHLATGEMKNSFEHLNEVVAVAFSRDGTTLATGTKIDGAVALWSARPRARKKTFELLRGGSSDHILTVPVLAPDGTALLERHEDNRTLGLWDTLALRETTRFTLEYDSATRFAISPSGKLLAIGDENGAIKLLELAIRREIARFTNSTAAVWCLAFSHDGTQLAARTADHKIRAWDVEIKRLLAEIEANPSSVSWTHSSVFTFSPDGKAVSMGYGDGSAEVVDLVNRRRMAHLKGHKATVSGVVLLPDGKTAATASYDQAVKLWDLGTQRELATLRGEWLACFALAASPDGRRLASGGGESTIRVWDTPTRQLVAIIKGTPGDEVVHLAFSPDGNTLNAVTRHTLRVWHAPTMVEIDRAEKPDTNENE